MAGAVDCVAIEILDDYLDRYDKPREAIPRVLAAQLRNARQDARLWRNGVSAEKEERAQYWERKVHLLRAVALAWGSHCASRVKEKESPC